MATDIVNLGKRQIYFKLMIDGVSSRAFSATTMDTIAPLPISPREQVIEFSRAAYAKNRKDIEDFLQNGESLLVIQAVMILSTPSIWSFWEG